jgi:hypothetical protein
MTEHEIIESIRKDMVTVTFRIERELPKETITRSLMIRATTELELILHRRWLAVNGYDRDACVKSSL